MQKKTKKIIISTILLLLTISIIILLTKNTNKQIPQPLTEQAKAQYETIIGNQTYDITNAVLEPEGITPTVSAGMIPVKWDGTNWIVTTRENEDWYDYKTGIPAYVMLNDGYYKSEIEQGIDERQLMQNNVGVGVPDEAGARGTIYMWVPRFAYSAQGEILYIKQSHSVAGTYAMPEIFTYQTEKRDLSIAGIWVEYNPLSNTNAVNTKISNMQGSNNQYGFIANTIGTNANNEPSYKTTIETYINAISTDTETDKNANVGASIARPQLDDISNPNRTILKIVNTNKLEPIKGKSYYDTNKEKIKIEITYRTNAITQILNKNGEELSSNSTTADSGNEIIGNGTYKYIAIDSEGNIKEITTKVEGLKIYVIPDLETLKQFRDEVNAGSDFTGIKVIQTADIAMNEGKYAINSETGEITFTEDAEQWQPIADYTNYQIYFRGDYDGQGHTISGVYIDSKNQYQGLFGCCTSGTIKNLNISKSKITSTADYIGGIAGNAREVENCSNYLTEINGNNCVGGVIGYANNIEKCSNSAKVNGSINVGGIVGYASKYANSMTNINDCYNIGEISAIGAHVGGIAGNASSNINNCYNMGIITITNSVAGGICGYINNEYVEIKNCYNFGNVYGKGANVAGIIGEGYRLKSITNCYNVGNIISELAQVAGIIGYSYDMKTIDRCYNLGKITSKGYSAGIIGYIYNASLTISNCYNNGEITSTNDYCGGILGISNSTVKIESCYNLANILGRNYVGGIAGKNLYGTTGGGSSYRHNAMIDSYNFGNITGNTYIGGCSGYYQGNTVSIFSKNYNMGTVNGNSYLGGVIGGKTTYCSVSDCYYEAETANYGIASPQSNSGCNTATREEIILQIEQLEEYKNDTYNINEGLPILDWQSDNDKLNLINSDNAFVEDTEGINNGYPLLAWQVE